MKATTYTLLVTITDKAPPSPEILAYIVRNVLELGVGEIKPMETVADAIEGTRPLPAAVRLKHAAIVDGAA